MRARRKPWGPAALALLAERKGPDACVICDGPIPLSQTPSARSARAKAGGSVRRTCGDPECSEAWRDVLSRDRKRQQSEALIVALERTVALARKMPSPELRLEVLGIAEVLEGAAHRELGSEARAR